MLERNDLEVLASRAAVATVLMAFHRGEAHLASSLSCIDGLVSSYAYKLFVDKQARIILSKGHAAPALYAVLSEFGLIGKSELHSFNTSNSRLGIHPSKYKIDEIEFSSGSLGHGLSLGAGIALGNKLRGVRSPVIVMVGDGEINEGSIWEGAQVASTQELNNLVVLVDFNKIQSVGTYFDISRNQSISEKFEAFGWNSIVVNGHKTEKIYEHLVTLAKIQSNSPTAIILDSIAGARISFMQNKVLWHYRRPDQNDLEIALKELNAKEIAADLLEIFL